MLTTNPQFERQGIYISFFIAFAIQHSYFHCVDAHNPRTQKMTNRPMFDILKLRILLF